MADAAVLKTAEAKASCGFDPHLRYQSCVARDGAKTFAGVGY